MAFLIESAWVAIKYERLSTKPGRRCGRIVHDLRLNYERFVAWLVDAANHAVGSVDQVVGLATVKERRLIDSCSREVTGND